MFKHLSAIICVFLFIPNIVFSGIGVGESPAQITHVELTSFFADKKFSIIAKP